MRNKILLLFSLIFIQNGFSQTDKKEDSLLNKSYKYLEGKIKNSSVKNEHKSIYIDTYLNKAKKEKDTVNIGFGFYFKIIENLHDYSDSSIKGIAINERGLIYSDSIINYTKNIEHKTFPGLGYIIKGYLFFNLGNEKKSLNNYLIAYKYAQKHDNKTQLADIKDVIDIIKNDIKSTLKETKEELDSLLIKKKEGKVDLYYYLSTLKNHINDLQKEKKYTKAADYIDLGISESINLKAKEKEHYYTFVFSSGINYFLLKNHNQALDSINKAENMLDLYSLQLAYYLKGKIYTERDTTVALQYFNKVDSIFQINNTNMYGLFDNYKSLIAIHKANNNYGKQIENIDKLIYADSIVNANKLDYEEKILHQYEIPKYKHEKEKIILDLEEKKRKKGSRIFYLSLAIVLVSLFSLYFLSEQLRYKKRYHQLLQKNNLINDNKDVTKDSNLTRIDIPEDIINKILSDLNNFEQQQNYLDNTINLNTLSKKIGTNSTYLSKVINKVKEKSFSQYLNDLRIAYVTQELKHNKTMRKHTIYAIAKEVGFNNAESFSKAFYKKNKIYPSYFIKQLNKDNL